MCFSINIWNLLTLSAFLMCCGKLFHNLTPSYVREFRPWVVVLHFGCMMILLRKEHFNSEAYNVETRVEL